MQAAALLLPYEAEIRRHHSLRNEHLLDLRFATTLILDSRTIGNKFHWFISDLFHGIFFYQPNRIKDSRILERCVGGETSLNYSIVTRVLSPVVSCLMDVGSN